MSADTWWWYSSDGCGRVINIDTLVYSEVCAIMCTRLLLSAQHLLWLKVTNLAQTYLSSAL